MNNDIAQAQVAQARGVGEPTEEIFQGFVRLIAASDEETYTLTDVSMELIAESREMPDNSPRTIAYEAFDAFCRDILSRDTRNFVSREFRILTDVDVFNAKIAQYTAMSLAEVIALARERPANDGDYDRILPFFIYDLGIRMRRCDLMMFAFEHLNFIDSHSVEIRSAEIRRLGNHLNDLTEELAQTYGERTRLGLEVKGLETIRTMYTNTQHESRVLEMQLTAEKNAVREEMFTMETEHINKEIKLQQEKTELQNKLDIILGHAKT